MELFLYFILGVIFIQWVLPLGDSVAALINAYIELVKGYASKKVSKINKEIEDMSKETDTPKRLIGFTVQDTEEEEEDEEQ